MQHVTAHHKCCQSAMEGAVVSVATWLQVHVGWLEGGTAILAFRGTQTAQDGLQDVKIVRQSIDHLQGMFPGTQAHSGLSSTAAPQCCCDW